VLSLSLNFPVSGFWVHQIEIIERRGISFVKILDIRITTIIVKVLLQKVDPVQGLDNWDW